VSTHGPDQLRELNAMQRNQDRSYWTSSAIFVVANAVLAAVFFQQEEHYLARSGIGLLGLLTTGVWYLIATRAHQYEADWLKKAESLETALGIDAKYRVWGDRPKGISTWNSIMIAVVSFAAFWVVGTSFAIWNLVI
jgi:hypothetical protein